MSFSNILRIFSDPLSITSLVITLMLMLMSYYYFYSRASIQNNFRYDVFISFKREDTPSNFVDDLYQALTDKGIQTHKEVEMGERIGVQLVRAIEDSKIYIIVFSENYNSSSWSLDELFEIMKSHKNNGRKVYLVFYDVTRSEVRDQIKAFGYAISRLENQTGAVGEASSRLEKQDAERWRAALEEAAGLRGGWELGNYNDMAEDKCIEQIVEKISQKIKGMGGAGETTTASMFGLKNLGILLMITLMIMLMVFIYYFYPMPSSSNSSAPNIMVSTSTSLVITLMLLLMSYYYFYSRASSSNSTSSIQNNFRYDVFISSRTDDIPSAFVDDLYYVLMANGIQTHMDVEAGDRIGVQLVRAIEDSKTYIVVFSKNYAFSSWCLDELVEIIDSHMKNGRKVYPVFFDVTRRQVRYQSGDVDEVFSRLENQTGAVGEAFSRLENQDAERWRAALEEAAGLRGGWELGNYSDL